MTISLKSLYARYRMPISITFILLSLEAYLLVLIPLGIGWSIDALMQKSLEGVYLLGLILLGILIISTTRRMYDTRIYSKVYALLSTHLIKTHKRDGVDTSVIVTRSDLVKELVDFFEHDLTQAYTSLVGVIGALLMIAFLNLTVFGICVASFIIIALVYQVSEASIFDTNAQLNRELERRLNRIKDKNSLLIPHFRKISQSMIRLSDIESYNYIVIQILIAVILIVSIFIGMEASLSTGDIFALLTYVLNFSFEVLTLPIIFQQFIRLQEITQRINPKRIEDESTID